MLRFDILIRYCGQLAVNLVSWFTMPAGHRWFLYGALLPTLLTCTNAFYLPGAAPHDYHEGEPVRLLVNALTPMLAGSDNAKIVRSCIH